MGSEGHPGDLRLHSTADDTDGLRKLSSRYTHVHVVYSSLHSETPNLDLSLETKNLGCNSSLATFCVSYSKLSKFTRHLFFPSVKQRL